MMNHVMIDLETFGTRPGSALRSVGAVLFDPREGPLSADAPRLYKKIKPMSCWVAGLVVDRDTLSWWDKQPQHVQDELKRDQEDLDLVVFDVHQWFTRVGGRYVWCQGASFDEPLWTAAARAIGAAPPWKFWDVRCTRTAYDAAGLDPRSVPRGGTHHNALDDAVHQVACVQRAFEMIAARVAA